MTMGSPVDNFLVVMATNCNTLLAFTDNETKFSYNLQNNVDNVTNEEQLRLTRTVVQRILVPIIVIVGIMGNLVSIIVLTRPSMKSSTNCYLTFLSVFDSLYLVTSFTLSFKHYPLINDKEMYKIWFPYGRVLSDTWSNASVILTVTFTLERYIAVCHPMKGRVICTQKRAKMIALGMALFAIVCTFPEFAEWEVIKIDDENSTVIKIIQTEFSKTDSYSIGYYYFLAIMFSFIPLAVLCIFNILLIRTVLKATEERKLLTHNINCKADDLRQWEQRKTTSMLIAVVIVFIVCQLPSAILIVYSTYRDIMNIELSAYEYNNLIIAGNVSNILIQFNAAINFILYSALGSKFRRVFHRLLIRVFSCIKSRDSGRHVTFYSRSHCNRYILRYSPGDKPENIKESPCKRALIAFQLSNTASYSSCENVDETSNPIFEM